MPRSAGAGCNSCRAARYEFGCPRDRWAADRGRRERPARVARCPNRGRHNARQPVAENGQPRPRADTEPGLALQQATARKHRTYPELFGAGRVRCRLVVLGMEVGGRISSGASAFLRRLARARAKQRAPWAAEATRRSLQRRWMALASFAGLRAHASTLLELPAVPIDFSDGTEMPLGDFLAGAAGDEDRLGRSTKGCVQKRGNAAKTQTVSIWGIPFSTTDDCSPTAYHAKLRNDFAGEPLPWPLQRRRGKANYMFDRQRICVICAVTVAARWIPRHPNR